MKNILLLGAGKAAPYLIKYLLKEGKRHRWQLRVADRVSTTAAALLQDHSEAEAISLDITDSVARERAISESDLVISLLPATFHLLVAEHALAAGVHMLTASYAKEDLRKLDKAFASKDLLLLMEMGLDPGIDHMIAMKIIHRIRKKGHSLRSFEAFTGALLDPSCDSKNLWQYKFSWSPQQVLRAGQEGAQFLQEGAIKFIPYQHIFRRIRRIHIPQKGYFEGYGNRDSLSYREIYDLGNISSLYRGTLRPLGFCEAWHAMVQLGLTDTSYSISNLEHMSHREFLNTFLMHHPTDSVELKLAHYLRLDLYSEVMDKLRWLGLFDATPIGMRGSATAIEVLQHIISKKWQMQPTDRDQIVLWERVLFTEVETGRLRERQAYFVCRGENADRTAISKTVGLTLGIVTRLLLEHKLKSLKGLQLPIKPEIYNPVLEELITYGLSYQEEEVEPEATAHMP